MTVQSHPVPASWTDIPVLSLEETVFYLTFGSATILVLVLGAALVLSPFASRRRDDWYTRAILRFTLLLAVALVVGIPANIIFVAAFRYRYYVPGDPTVDWLPFVPSGGWVIDPGFGGRFINGGSPQLLRVLWLVLAAPVWFIAWRLHCRLTARFR